MLGAKRVAVHGDRLCVSEGGSESENEKDEAKHEQLQELKTKEGQARDSAQGGT